MDKFFLASAEKKSSIRDFVFDDLYRNAQEKRKLDKDKKFIYFKAIIKMKNEFGQNKRSLYEKVFENNDEDGSLKGFRQAVSPYATVFNRPPKVFHVEKINNRSFKIYKDKKTSFLEENSTNEIPSIDDINFQVHFKRGKSELSSKRPKIRSVIAEYERINGMNKPERVKTT